MTMSRLNLVKGLGPVFQIAEGVIIELPDDVHKVLDLTDESHLAHNVVCATRYGQWTIPRCIQCDE